MLRRLLHLLVVVVLVLGPLTPGRAHAQSLRDMTCDSGNPYLRFVAGWFVAVGAQFPTLGSVINSSICQWLGGYVNSPVPGSSDWVRSLVKDAVDTGRGVSLADERVRNELNYLAPTVMGQWDSGSLGGVPGWYATNPQNGMSLWSTGLQSRPAYPKFQIYTGQVPGYQSFNYTMMGRSQTRGTLGAPCEVGGSVGSWTTGLNYTTAGGWVDVPGPPCAWWQGWINNAPLSGTSAGSVFVGAQARFSTDNGGTWQYVDVHPADRPNYDWMDTTPTQIFPPTSWDEVIGKTWTDCQGRGVYWCKAAAYGAYATPQATPNATATAAVGATATAIVSANATAQALNLQATATAQVHASATAVAVQATQTVAAYATAVRNNEATATAYAYQVTQGQLTPVASPVAFPEPADTQAGLLGQIYNTLTAVVNVIWTLPDRMWSTLEGRLAGWFIPTRGIPARMGAYQLQMAGRFPMAVSGTIETCVLPIFQAGSDELVIRIPAGSLGTYQVGIAPGVVGSITRTASQVVAFILVPLYVLSIARRFLELGGTGDAE